MIKTISIKNIILIEKLDIEFNRGLNVITGETGAGKSILLGAIELIVGGKGSGDLVRTGEDKGFIEIVFDLNNCPNIVKDLDDKGFDIEDNVLVIKREVYADGRSRCFINHSNSTVTQLKSIGEFLVDISSQHNHQSLLNISHHLTLLDNYSNLEERLKNLTEDFENYKTLKKELEELTEKDIEKEKVLEYNQFAVEEIEKSNLTPGEDVELENRLRYLNNFQKMKEIIDFSYENLYSKEKAVIPLLEVIIADLEKGLELDESLKTLLEELKEASYKLENANDLLRERYTDMDTFPEDHEEVLERVDEIKSLKKKYGETIEEIITFKDKCQKEIEAIDYNTAKIEQLQKTLENKEKELSEMAFSISKERQTKAKKLESLIESELSYLGMTNSSFKIDFKYVADEDSFIRVGEKGVRLSERGIDRVEYLFSANKGEPLKPLTKIISGGELSRVMLAIRTILAMADEVDCLLFDEVDAGIGGETAKKVGQKIRHISDKRQIICITHSPQIASLSETHYLVRKFQQGNRMTSKLTQLSEEEKVREIARMIGGDDITEISIEHAKELISKG